MQRGGRAATGCSRKDQHYYRPARILQPYQNMTAYSEHTFQPFSIFDRNRVARRNWLHLLGTVSSTVEFHKLQCLVDSPVATVDEASCFVDLSVMSISV